MWFYRQESIKVSYHPAKFGGHRHCGSENIMVLMCHVLLEDHVVKGVVTLRAGAHQGKLPYCLVWWPCPLW